MLFDNSKNETNFPYKLLLTDATVLRLCKTFAYNSRANIKLSKTESHKIVKLDNQGNF